MISDETKKAITNRELSSMMAEFKKRPLLTADQEVELGNQVQAGVALMLSIDPDCSGRFGRFDPAQLTPKDLKKWQKAVRAKNKMVAANMRLVIHIGSRSGFFSTASGQMDAQDLVQHGALGLDHAAEKFDPTKGFKFSTYAYWWVKQAMTRGMQAEMRHIKLPEHILSDLWRLRKISSHLAQRLGAAPSREQIIDEASRSKVFKKSLTPERLDYLLEKSSLPYSLDYLVSETSRLGDFIASDFNLSETSERQLAFDQVIDEARKCLDAEEINIMRLRYIDQLPTKEISEETGLSANKIKTIEQRSLRRLRKAMSQYPAVAV
ncbi:MAG: sigma-70 family RNA polymerase sigma factor [Cyanobacteria bacterium J06607_13]